jgi:hypothetical protein
MPPALFAIVILKITSHFLATILLFYGSCQSWYDRCGAPCPACFPLKWGLMNFFPTGRSGPWFSQWFSHITGMTGTHHFTQLLVKMEFHWLFAWAGLKLWSCQSQFPK